MRPHHGAILVAILNSTLFTLYLLRFSYLELFAFWECKEGCIRLIFRNTWKLRRHKELKHRKNLNLAEILNIPYKIRRNMSILCLGIENKDLMSVCACFYSDIPGDPFVNVGNPYIFCSTVVFFNMTTCFLCFFFVCFHSILNTRGERVAVLVCDSFTCVIETCIIQP